MENNELLFVIQLVFIWFFNYNYYTPTHFHRERCTGLRQQLLLNSKSLTRQTITIIYII